MRPVRSLVLIVFAAVLRFIESSPGNIDDAFILLVYIKRLTSGSPLYYNLSDGRLDGFTSFLDLVVKAALIRVLPAGDPILIIWWISLLLYVVTAVWAFVIVRRLAPRDPRLALLTGLCVATNPGFAEGASFLLETPLFVLIGLALVGSLALGRLPQTARRGALFAGGLAALALARPEGLPLAGLLLAFHVLIEDSPWRCRRVAVLGFTALIGAYYVWRIRYFGYWAPNTYYAKTSASRLQEVRDGLGYVTRFTLGIGAPGMLLLLLAPAFGLSRKWHNFESRRRMLVICTLALAGLGMVVWAGGDCYSGGRFLALPLVLAIMATAMAGAGITERAGVRARRALGVLLAGQLVLMIWVPMYLLIARPAELRQHLRDNIPVRAASFRCDQEVAARLAALVGNGKVAQTDYQRLKYFADDLQVIDLTGLNDRRIAHRPVDGQVLWGKIDLADAAALQPDVLVLGHHTPPHPAPMSATSFGQLLATPALSEESLGYEIAPVFFPPLVATFRTASLPVCGGYFHFLIRHDHAAAYAQKGVLVGPADAQ